MNPAMAAALARYPVGAEARRRVRDLRHSEFPLGDRLDVARQLAGQGAHRAAALWLARAVRQAPEADLPEVAYRLGNALRLAGHPRPAAIVLEAVCSERPGWDEPVRSLAWLYRHAGSPGAAAAVMQRWLDAPGITDHDLRTGAGFLLDLGRVAEAEAALGRVVAPDPALLAERGSLLLKLGRFDEGERVLRESLRRDPSQGGAWLRLVQVRRWASAAGSPMAELQAARSRPGLDAPMAAAIGFALVKVSDDLGRFEQAWAEAERANALRSDSAHFDRAAWARYENTLYHVFTRETLERISNRRPGSPAPVFVVGMPRSGTTLIERRLGRHSRLYPCGELELVEALGLELAGDRQYPHGLAGVADEAFARAAGTWPGRVPGGIPAGQEAIDKNPINFIHLGLIYKLFPEARIIHCRRNPLDTALSIWFQNFAHPRNDYAYRMEDLAWMYGFYQRLMGWWERTLPRPLLAVDYERVVADPEGELRKLVSGLGLEWEGAVPEAPAGGEGAIATASLWQARQPTYRHAAGRARNYEPWIEPLRKALRREGVDV